MSINVAALSAAQVEQLCTDFAALSPDPHPDRPPSREKLLELLKNHLRLWNRIVAVGGNEFALELSIEENAP